MLHGNLKGTQDSSLETQGNGKAYNKSVISLKILLIFESKTIQKYIFFL